ncbi:glycoside hydrolase family 16 protein [Cylindrobasidium torrendii FP15055 ss-10]|uniref:Glycoside hydrolase family 16 protein n=1 Tax=Cylindrobasidium torrendii FP15055 ss-10 TaxID=1314674 RepID=A0A0D7BE26_9AGAR|nr:glycoside hydrolase family 16 protein [Cylindrobasidium torrendii FP15055 ss-10]
MTLITLLFLPLLGVSATWYHATEAWVGPNLLPNFEFDAIPDPTHGRVLYVNETVAFAEDLVQVFPDSVIIAADHTTTLTADGPGRKSIRLRSKVQYTDGVTVFDIRHMPEGCGTWPAVWSFGDDWPNGGEIDIVEGDNDRPYNKATLHTAKGCSMPPLRLQTGTIDQADCDASVNYNHGCSVIDRHPLSFGPPFNANGGGWFAMEKTAEFIKVWFWARDDLWVPEDVREGEDVVKPAFWGIPMAHFPNTQCDMDKFFGPQNIIINLTFCGDLAGNTYANTTCPSTCVDYVDNNPEAFKNAFFDLASIRRYETDAFGTY